MFSWITDLFQWFGTWIPRVIIVRATQEGVKYKMGYKVVKLTPGVHIYLPALSDIEIVYIVRQSLDLVPQTIVCQDGKVCIFSGVVMYSINDVIKYLTKNFDSDQAISEIALAEMRGVLVNKTFEEIQRDSKVLTNQLTKAITEGLNDFGVCLEYVRLKEFAPCKVLKIVKDEKPSGVSGTMEIL